MLRLLSGHLQRLFCQIIYQPNPRQLKAIIRAIPEVTKVREDKKVVIWRLKLTILSALSYY
jgi:hypothetical protein